MRLRKSSKMICDHMINYFKKPLNAIAGHLKLARTKHVALCLLLGTDTFSGDTHQKGNTEICLMKSYT